MTMDTTQRKSVHFLDHWKQRRRKWVKRQGKNFIRGLSNFIGRQSLVGDMPVYDKTQFDFVAMMEENWETIRDEVKQVLEHRDAIPAFVEVSADQKKIASDKRWKTFILFGFGAPLEKNCAAAPETARMLQKVPNLQTAFFSILGPNYHIAPHRGVSKTIMRVHVGLIVPKDRENCTIRIADQKVSWKEGEAFVFDDTYDHEVWNNTDEERVVLLFDFDRPMKLWGRIVHKTFLAGLRMSAYYREPKKNIGSIEDRFEAAVKRAQDMTENA